MPYATLEALRAAIPASGSTDHEDHTRGIVDALIGGIRKTTVTLSSADILALDSPAQTLVAAPGAGKWVLIHKAIGILDYATTAYLTGDGAAIQYGVGGASIASVTTFLQSASKVTNILTVDDPNTDVANLENKPVVLSAYAGVTLGDSPVTLTLWYSIEDVP